MRELEGVNVARQAPFLNYIENGKFSAENGLYWEVKVPEGHYFAMGIIAIKVLTVVSGALFRRKLNRSRILYLDA